MVGSLASNELEMTWKPVVVSTNQVFGLGWTEENDEKPHCGRRLPGRGLNPRHPNKNQDCHSFEKQVSGGGVPILLCSHALRDMPYCRRAEVVCSLYQVEVVEWFKWLGTVLSARSLGFNARRFHMRFVSEELRLEEFFSELILFPRGNLHFAIALSSYDAGP